MCFVDLMNLQRAYEPPHNGSSAIRHFKAVMRSKYHKGKKVVVTGELGLGARLSEMCLIMIIIGASVSKPHTSELN